MCKKMGFQVIISPYEADAQLAFLSREGVVDGILSEDSDLLVFGTKTLITKMDDGGICKRIERESVKKVDSLKIFSDPIRWLRYACIMQGQKISVK